MSGRNVPLVEELIPVPSVPAALKAFADRPRLVLFDSALTREPVGRYSFLTADPFAFEEGRNGQYSVPGTQIPVVETQHVGPGPASAGRVDPLRGIRECMERYATEGLAELPPFQGGAAGLLGYELGRAWERVPAPRHDEFALPALAVGFYDWVIAWDHRQNRAWIISQGFPETEPARRTDRAARRIAEVREVLNVAAHPSRRTKSQLSNLKSQIPALYPPRPMAGAPGLTSNFSRDEYLGAVQKAIDYIYSGDIFQVNLSQRLLFAASGDPIDLYLRLRERNPAPFAGYLACDDWAVASASPERFVCVVDGEVETRPIKGTRRRGSAPEADLFTGDALRESEKDQAENVMIVDLLRNDLSRVCAPGSVRVPDLCRVETYETVQHLVSEIRGRLRPEKSPWDLFRAVFPGGSITGAPKVRAMEIIAELEPTARGPYCGSLFYVGFDGNADSSILIRTFTVRHGWIQFPVGGGIVAQSDPVAEYEETLDKAAGMIRAL